MEELAKKTFEACRAEVKNKTHDNKPIPDWENLTDTVRAGWLAAATFAYEVGATDQNANIKRVVGRALDSLK
jgi:hypothetical protein